MADGRAMGNGMSELIWPGRKVSDREEIEAVLRGLFGPISRMAAYVYSQASPAVRRAIGVDDLVQEVLIAIWRELKAPGETTLRSPEALRNFIFAILRNQVAKAARKGKRYTPLPSDWAAPSQSVLDELTASLDYRLLEQAVCDLEAIVERAETVLRRALTRLSLAEARGVDAWLLDAGYIEAGEPHGLSLAQMRRAVRNVGDGFLGYFVSRIRCELKALYDISPAAAAGIRFGRLQRLVLGRRTGRHKRRDRVDQAQKRSLVEYRNGGHAENDHAA